MASTTPASEVAGLADAVTPRPGQQPGPGATVWLFNETLEQQPDGSWRGWIEPLDGSSERVMEVVRDTPEEVRDFWIIEWSRIDQDLGQEEWDRFRELHAKPFVRESLPPIGWPPTSGRYRKLGFLPEYDDGRERPEDSA